MTDLLHDAVRAIGESHAEAARFRAAVDALPATKPRNLGELIDAAALASHRFRHCRCRDDCPHDGAAVDAEAEVRGYLAGKLGLTVDQMDALGGML